MKHTLSVEYAGCNLTVVVKDMGRDADDWFEESIYCDGDLTDLLQRITSGGDWSGYDDLMDKVHEALVEARGNPFGEMNAATGGFRSEDI